MKKILGISIVAVLAVVPMMAQADVTAATTSSTPYAGVALDADAHIATTSYVQGAYNAAIGAVNDLAGDKQDNLTNGTSAINSTVKTTVGAATGENAASDTALVTEKAVRTAIADAITDAGGQTAQQVEDKIDAAAGSGLATNNSGVLSVKYDNTTIDLDGSGNLEVKDGGLTAAKLASGAKAVGTANNAVNDKLTTQGYVTEAIATALTNGTDAYQTVSDVQGLIDTAAAGTTDGLTSSNGVLSVQAGEGITVTSGGVNVDYDNTTIGLVGGNGADANKIEVKDGSITAAKIATGTITTTQVADGAMAKGAANDAVNNKLTTQGYVTEAISAALTNGSDAYQTSTQVASAVQTGAQGGTFTPTATGLTSTTVGAAINEVATDAATALSNKRVTVYTTWNSVAAADTAQVTLSDAAGA